MKQKPCKEISKKCKRVISLCSDSLGVDRNDFNNALIFGGNQVFEDAFFDALKVRYPELGHAKCLGYSHEYGRFFLM